MQRLPDDLRWERRQVDPNAVFYAKLKYRYNFAPELVVRLFCPGLTGQDR